MKGYHRLCLMEREIIGLLYHSGVGIREISRRLHRSASTLSREIKRNKGGFYYVPVTANNKARRRCCRNPRKLFKDKRLRQMVLSGLRRQWERGTNENTNGLIRQYFPKGTDFNQVSAYEMRKVQDRLNGRPRNVLNWKTPFEAFNELLQ